jgi:hypothetical protein
MRIHNDRYYGFFGINPQATPILLQQVDKRPRCAPGDSGLRRCLHFALHLSEARTMQVRFAAASAALQHWLLELASTKYLLQLL